MIELEPAEWDVIDTPIFQRLRGVQQLAMTHLVYPGARHSRFEHSIGCCEVAGRVAKSLDLPDDERRLVRFAALLHDVGHGPFSHVSDAVFGALIDDPDQDPGEIHEHISAAVALHDPRVRRALGEFAEPVADLLAHRGEHTERTLARDIVSGPADIDKLDYLLRDSHYCGVNYGRYDLDKLTNSVTAIEDGRETYLGYRESAVYALEEMLLARYHMHRQVYGHRTRIASNLALTRAMILGVRESVLPVEVFRPPADPGSEFVGSYTDWTDSHVLYRLLHALPQSTAMAMAQAVINRRLPKRVVQLDDTALRSQLKAEARKWIKSPSAFNATGPEPAEHYLAEALGVAPDLVFLHVDAQDDPVSRPGTFAVADKDIHLRMREGGWLPLQDVSQVFDARRAEERLVVSVFVWPLEGQDTAAMESTVLDHLPAALESAAAAR